MRYTNVHLDFCLRFSTLIGQIGRVPLFGAGPRRYIRSQLFRLAVTIFCRALTASLRQKGKRKQVVARAICTTELPLNPSPLTFRNNQIQILQTSSTHAAMAANVSQQFTNTHGTWLSHARRIGISVYFYDAYNFSLHSFKARQRNTRCLHAE